MKSQKATDDVGTQAIRSMTRLNDHASRSAVKFKATSVTDITGFGLAGHAKEMANGSDVTLIIELNNLPILPGAKDAYQRGFLTRASESNRDANASAISGIAKENSVLEELLFDPQTSGGLLVSLPPEHAESYVNEVSEKQGFGCTIIGEVIPRIDRSNCNTLIAAAHSALIVNWILNSIFIEPLSRNKQASHRPQALFCASGS